MCRQDSKINCHGCVYKGNYVDVLVEQRVADILSQWSPKVLQKQRTAMQKGILLLDL